MGAHSVAAWIAAFFLASSLFSGTVALRLLLLFSGAALCAWVAFRDRTVRKLPPLWIPFALWAAWSAATLLWSIDADRSAKELRNEVFYTGLAFWMCYVAAQARHAIRIIPAVLAAASVVISAIALYFFFVQPMQYAQGAHGGSGNYSSVLLTLMSTTLAAAWYLRRLSGRLSLTCLAIALLLAISAYTTLNRTVWIGFALQLIIIGLLLSPQSWLSTTRGRLRLLAAALAVSAAAGAMTWVTQVEREHFGGGPIAKDPRLTIWREALERIEERPLTGYGFGRGLLRKELTRETRDNFAWHSHNLFLDAVVQTGAVGLALLLVLFAATLRQGWRMIRKQEPLAVACGVAVVAIVMGMLVRNMTDVLWVRHIALLYWGCIALLFAWGQTGKQAAGG
jgi:O-antigen ligase